MKGKGTACTVLSGVLAGVGDELCTGRACNDILQLLLYGLMVKEEPETLAQNSQGTSRRTECKGSSHQPAWKAASFGHLLLQACGIE